MIDLFGHVAYLLIFLGMIALGRRKQIGWVLRLLGAAIWLVLGVQLGLTSIWMWEIVFIGTDLYGYYLWRKHEAAIRESQGPEVATARSCPHC